VAVAAVQAADAVVAVDLVAAGIPAKTVFCLDSAALASAPSKKTASAVFLMGDAAARHAQARCWHSGTGVGTGCLA
jgi:hypothetical protein